MNMSNFVSSLIRTTAIGGVLLLFFVQASTLFAAEPTKAAVIESLEQLLGLLERNDYEAAS